jgi:hypothetical protein
MGIAPFTKAQNHDDDTPRTLDISTLTNEDDVVRCPGGVAG